MTTDWALAYLCGAYTALLTTPPGWALILGTLAYVGLAEAMAP